jgi:competence protein ComEC
MASLKVTLIDVGWGDSILLESQDGGTTRYGLIDSNDTSTLRSTYIFLRRYFEKADINISDSKPIFQFVLLSHAHTDHGQGLKAIMREFGTENFWYPKSLRQGMLGNLLRYANSSNNVGWHEALHTDKVLPNFGPVRMSVLWPQDNGINSNENNNSVVLVLLLDRVSFVMTGDAEKEVWTTIRDSIPRSTRFFKVPHHGSVNGTFGDDNKAVWLDQCPRSAKLGVSSHIRPFEHPDQEVIDLFDTNNRNYYRTDKQYHLTFETNGRRTKVKYWH